MAGPKADPLGRVLRNSAFIFICCLNCQRAAEQQQTLSEQSLRPWGSTILQLCLLTLQVGLPKTWASHSRCVVLDNALYSIGSRFGGRWSVG